MARQNSVGPSRSGDQFHYQWAARQCLGLLAARDGLVAVAIEGASLDEGGASTYSLPFSEGDLRITLGNSADRSQCGFRFEASTETSLDESLVT